jgi:hypothetical protein
MYYELGRLQSLKHHVKVEREKTIKQDKKKEKRTNIRMNFKQ